jgi:cytochrome c556
MKKMAVVVGVLLLGSGAVMADQKLAVSQDNFMRGLAKSLYDVLGKMARGNIPYDQAAVDAAIAQIEADVPKIPDTFKDNPKEDVANGHYGASQKVWRNKADFDSKVPPVLKAVASVKGTVKDVGSLKVAFKTIEDACNGCHETYRVKLK